MFKMKKRVQKLYCFSPTVMAITFLFEVFAAGWILIKYKSDKIMLLIVAILLALAGFQAAEFMVCGGFGVSGAEWARFGYVSITLLPPLGLHLSHKIAGKKTGNLVKISYLTCAIFSLCYIFMTDAVAHGACRANYSVFNTPNGLSELFGLYYYGWLLTGIGFSFKQVNDLKKKNPEKNTQIISALTWLAVGYLSFVLPTTFVNIIDPSTIEGIPSIMCGFAVLLAIILLGFVAPKVLGKKSRSSSASFSTAE